MNTVISTPTPTTDRQGNTAYLVTVTYAFMPLAYRLHNESAYGIDCQAAFADGTPSWYGTNMGSLDLPSETIAELRALWETLFAPSPADHAVLLLELIADPIGECYVCGATAWVHITHGPLCPSHAAVYEEWQSQLTDDSPTINTTPKYEAIKAAAQLAVSAFDLDPAHAIRLQTTAAGWCLLTLLANAAAKQFPERAAPFYEAKTTLLYMAICNASAAVGGKWWATPHHHGEYADTVVYIETSFARFAFHCRKADPALAWVLEDAPTSARGWSGLPLQSYPVQLIQGFLSGAETAAEIIALAQPAVTISGRIKPELFCSTCHDKGDCPDCGTVRPEPAYEPIGQCYVCGDASWDHDAHGPLCPSHAAVLDEWENQLADDFPTKA